jgi:thiamine-monophosphate kinase
MDEFSLIRQFFVDQPVSRSDVVLGIGDDGAVLQAPAGQQLVSTADTLVAGRHFPDATAAADVGYKALAVNLSDLAAMGAEPAWASLQLTLPEADESWLGQFRDGFFALAARHQVQLVGGDTVRGPLNVAVQLTGFVPPGQALTRGGAQPGDDIYVTGTLGDAALALQHLEVLSGPAQAWCRTRLNRPMPRCAAGIALRGVASAAIDLSDGLVADLGHVAEASGVGARIDVDLLPLSDAYREHRAAGGGLDAAVGGGDDYELCFTVAPAQQGRLEALAAGWDCGFTRIGVVTGDSGVEWHHGDGSSYRPGLTGFRHFT